jgi:hypothetical protein
MVEMTCKELINVLEENIDSPDIVHVIKMGEASVTEAVLISRKPVSRIMITYQDGTEDTFRVVRD